VTTSKIPLISSEIPEASDHFDLLRDATNYDLKRAQRRGREVGTYATYGNLSQTRVRPPNGARFGFFPKPNYSEARQLGQLQPKAVLKTNPSSRPTHTSFQFTRKFCAPTNARIAWLYEPRQPRNNLQKLAPILARVLISIPRGGSSNHSECASKIRAG
jgi:hypothetical protein